MNDNTKVIDMFANLNLGRGKIKAVNHIKNASAFVNGCYLAATHGDLTEEDLAALALTVEEMGADAPTFVVLPEYAMMAATEGKDLATTTYGYSYAVAFGPFGHVAGSKSRMNHVWPVDDTQIKNAFNKR